MISAVLGTGPVGGLGPDELAGAAGLLARHRLQGLARSRGLVVPGEAPELDAAFRRVRMGTALVAETAERACEALSAAGIECVRFKGAALVASGLYPDPGARPMDDADLLVRPGHAQAAVSVLTELGFEPWEPWRPGRTVWSDSFSLSDPGAPAALPVAIDLHWRTSYGSLRAGEGGGESLLWDGADRARQLPAPEAHLIVVAEHVLKHLRVKTHLLAYADLARLTAAVSDWDRVLRTARGRFFAYAIGVLLSVIRNDLGAPVPEVVEAELAPERARRARIRRRLGLRSLLARTGPVPGRLEGLRLRWDLVGGGGALATDVRAVLFPPGRWLRARYGHGGLARLWSRHAGGCLRWGLGGGPSPLSPNQ